MKPVSKEQCYRNMINQRKGRAELRDSYIRICFRQRKIDPIRNPTPLMIEIKRMEIQLKRAIQQSMEVLKNGTDAIRS